MKKVLLSLLVTVILITSFSVVTNAACYHEYQEECGDFLTTGYDSHYVFPFSSCLFYYRDQYTDEVCTKCGYEIKQTDTHRCYEYHYDCGDEDVYMCPY